MKYYLALFLILSCFTDLAAASLFSPLLRCKISKTSKFPFQILLNLNDSKEAYLEVKDSGRCTFKLAKSTFNEFGASGIFSTGIVGGKCLSKDKYGPVKNGFIKIEKFQTKQPEIYAYLLKDHQPFFCEIIEINKEKLKKLTK